MLQPASLLVGASGREIYDGDFPLCLSWVHDLARGSLLVRIPRRACALFLSKTPPVGTCLETSFPPAHSEGLPAMMSPFYASHL